MVAPIVKSAKAISSNCKMQIGHTLSLLIYILSYDVLECLLQHRLLQIVLKCIFVWIFFGICV